MKFGERVYYKFDDKHPYEEQLLNDSKRFGKGRVEFFTEGGYIGVSTDGSRLGRKEDDQAYLFKPNEILTLQEYFALSEDER